MSDGILREGWGSRWRLALVVAVVVLVAARYVVARSWKSRTLVIGSGDPPAIVHSSTIHGGMIETWDWTTNQTQTVGPVDLHPAPEGIRLVGGKTIVWLAGGDLHTLDLESPHARRTWKTPFPFDARSPSRFTLVGTSADHRLAVVQFEPMVQGSAGNVWSSDELAVIDIETGEVLSNRSWHSRMNASFEPGVFETYHVPGPSTDPNEPERGGRWRLTEQGGWELLPPSKTPNWVDNYVLGAVDAAGRWRLLAPGEVPIKGKETGELLKPWSPDAEHVVMRGNNNQELLLVHKTTKEIQSLGTDFSFQTLPTWTADLQHFVVTDANDDLLVFEMATGRVVASEVSGSFWRRFARGISAALTGAALCWIALAARQSEPLWAIVDLHVAGIIGQLAVYSLVGTILQTGLNWLTAFVAGAVPAVTVAFGMAIGWFFVNSQTNSGTKLKWSLLSTAVIALVPALTIALHIPPSLIFLAILLPVLSGLFFACVTAMILAPVTLLTGWRACDQPIEHKHGRFGLASLMLLIAGVAVVMGCVKLDLLPSNGEAILDGAMYLVPVFAIGLGWPGVAMLNINRRWRMGLGLGIAALIAGAMVARTWLRPVGWPMDFDRTAFGFAAATAPLVLGMAILFRKFGWRWRKVSAPVEQAVSSEAAA